MQKVKYKQNVNSIIFNIHTFRVHVLLFTSTFFQMPQTQQQQQQQQ